MLAFSWGFDMRCNSDRLVVERQAKFIFKSTRTIK